MTMKGSITNIIQQKNIQAIKHFEELFHPTYQNNYTIELVNKGIELKSLIEKKKNDLNFLNIASFNLCSFLKICLDEIKVTNAQGQEKIDLIRNILEKWTTAIANGNSFLTYDFAKEAISIFKDLDVNFLSKLKSPKYEVIPHAFKTIPKAFRAFVRLNNYSSDSDSLVVLSSLFDYFACHPEVFNYVERIEIAKKDFPFETASNEEYPVFSIFFNYNTVADPLSDAVLRTVERFISVGSDVINMKNSGEYSFQVATNTTLSQGFKNYKRFLLLMDILDEVYYKEKNYAFVLPD